MKTDSELQKEMMAEYEYSKPFVILLGTIVVFVWILALFCVTAGVTAIFNLITK
jgi:hypothetical protein